MKLDFMREVISQNKVMFNGRATIVITALGAKIVIKCDEKDKFDRKIGLGLAIYRSVQDKNSFFSYPEQAQFLRENFNYKQIANFYLHEYVGFNKKKIQNFL